MGTARVLGALLALSLFATGAGAQDSSDSDGGGLWEALRAMVSAQSEAFGEMLQSQQQLVEQEEALEEQLDHSAELRAMYREAVLLSALNVAWIRDSLEHWDCRIAEEQAGVARGRRTKLEAFSERLGRSSCPSVVDSADSKFSLDNIV